MDRSAASKLVRSLFESWAPSLLRYATRLTGSKERAEDLIQEAFLALYAKLRQGAKIANPKGWTLRVVRNQFLKGERAASHHGEEVDPSVLDELPLADSDGDRAIAELDAVTGLFTVLTPREEEVMLLRIQCLKYREIAAQLGINPNSVGVLLARALKKIQKRARVESLGRQIRERGKGDVSKTLQ